MNEDVFPIENRDFPVSHVIVNSGVFPAEVKTMSFYVASMPMCHINPWDFQRTHSVRVGRRFQS